MAITAGTRTQLIGLSVAMLGQAPGTGRLNHWVADIDEGMSVDDLANHIAESEAFQARYPTFSTNEEFAKDFLSDVLHGVPENIMTAAVDLVTVQLNDGVSRGSLVLAVVDALHDIAEKGMDHPAYVDLGMSANALVNKVSVASHYTLNARMEEPSSEVLSNVTADEDSVAMAIDAIDNPPMPPEEPPMGETYVLSATRDDVPGTDQDDTIIAEPVAQFSSLFTQTLQPFDVINGGDGMDTFYIYDVDAGDYNISNADVSNVEHVIVNAQAGITADMSEWSGLETVDLQRFAKTGDVSITVDGATVMTSRTFGGDNHVMINGAAGAVDLMAGPTTDVEIGSGAHTTSVMVKGGDHVEVGKNSGGKGQSETVTSVSVDGVKASPSEAGANTARMPNIVVHSNAIESVSLANSYGTVAVVNKSGEAEDLRLVVDAYGGQMVDDQGMPSRTVMQNGKICVTGEGSAENIMIDVVSDSMFDLASNEVKALDIMGDGKLSLAVEKFDQTASNTLGSITVGGSVSLTIDTAGNTALTTIDTSGSTGKSSIKTSAGEKALASVMTGSNDDSVTAATAAANMLASISTGAGNDKVTVSGAHRKAGLMVDLGDGDDSYTASGGGHNKDSSINGGMGRDTLRVDAGDGTYGTGAAASSIYSGFEVLEVTGGAGNYNMKLLSEVEEVRVTGNTASTVLSYVAGGTPLSVSGSAKAGDTEATVTYNLAAEAKGAGSLIDGNNSSILNVSLHANGAMDDSTAEGGTRTGQANLDLTLDNNIRGLVLSSDATPSAKPAKTVVEAKKVPKAGDYMNMITIVNEASALEEVKITGNAKVMLDGVGLGNLEYVNATENAAGVTVNASAATGNVKMTGGDGKDMFTGGAGNDTLMGGGGDDVLNAGGAGTGDKDANILMGGAGGDMLSGGIPGEGTDKFHYTANTDSQLSFDKEDKPTGHDTIMNFEDGTDKILLSKSLFAKAKGSIKADSDWEGWDENGTQTDSIERRLDTSADQSDAENKTFNSLKDFIGKGAGFFRSPDFDGGAASDEDIGSVGSTVLNSVAVVRDENPNNGDGWLFIDYNGDGNLDSDDIVIKLTGGVSIDSGSFEEAAS